MEELTNLISNFGFPITLVIAMGVAIYKIAVLYVKYVNEREKTLMENNKETLEILQKIVITMERMNDKIDMAIEIKKERGDKIA